MDYKEKYLKGLEEAKKTLDSLDENYRCYKLTKDDIRGIYTRLFPELTESEDERIRHALIEFLRDAYSRGNAPEECAKWIVWLDQPKEQKPCEDSGTDGNIMMQYIEEGEKRGIKEVISFPEKYGLHKEPQAADISANFEKAEKEKKDFVTSEFIRCIKKVEGFNEGETYWLEYIGDDTYVGRSDNILNSTFNITPKELFTHFKRLKDFGVKLSDFGMKGGVWKIMPLFKVGDFIKKKGGNYVPWKIAEVNEEDGYYCGNYQHGYPTELMFRDQRDYERVDNPGMPKINGKPISTENNVVNIYHWVPSADQLEAVRYLLEDYKPWLLCASEARKELATIYDEMLKLAKK
jgi:hypothetical protein